MALDTDEQTLQMHHCTVYGLFFKFPTAVLAQFTFYTRIHTDKARFFDLFVLTR